MTHPVGHPERTPTIVDAQIHVYLPESAERPWDPEFSQAHGRFLRWSEPVTIDRAIASMDAVGVDRALVTSFQLYPDIDYALEAARRYPARFLVNAQVDLYADDPLERLRGYVEHDAVAALRFALFGPNVYERLADGEFDAVFAAAAASGRLLTFTSPGRADVIGTLAERFPGTRFVVDHMGVPQRLTPEMPERPFEALGKVLDLAGLDNVSVKITGVPSFAREPFPFDDLREPVRSLVDRFGARRVHWGTDFVRTRTLRTYAEELHWILFAGWLSDEEKEWILGRSLLELIGWPEPAAA